MAIIAPPPTAPKKETLAIRLEVRVVDELRRYAAYLGTKNFSHIIACSLERVFKADAGYKAWLKTHPDLRTESKPQCNGSPASAQSTPRSIPALPGASVPGERQVSSRNTIGGA
jgi:hypothetical protein